MKILRPELNEVIRDRLEKYLLSQFDRAKQGRQTQVDDKYSRWSSNYYGIPAEEIRNVPWHKSSNVVVKIVRLFVETFAARTLNIVFATRPLITVRNYPSDVTDALQQYLDLKANTEWDFYELFKRMLHRGAKNGTVVTKTSYVQNFGIDVSDRGEEQVITYDGPSTKVIPFDDVYFWPITACDLSEVEIKFHKVRFSRGIAERKVAEGKWSISEEEMNKACKKPLDVKRDEEREQAGIFDQDLEEVHMVECYLDYAITNDSSKYYSIVAVICPEINKMVDVFHNPHPSNYENFHVYTPSPREDCIYGESWSEILASAQEEVSQIHNDRRNASFLESAPVFKRKSGSMVPNPSTNWYPGKVFDLDSLDDLDVISLGRGSQDMMNEELHVITLAERLMGIGSIMQGSAMGNSAKQGIYNTGGVMAVMSESNQRQDTNIRDARAVLGDIARCAFYLQAKMAPADPLLELMPPKEAALVRRAFEMTSRTQINYSKFDIKISSAGNNREVEKASLLQLSNFLGTHAQTLMGLTPQIIGAQNPQMKAMATAILKMSGWMADRLLGAYEESEAKGILPSVDEILGGSGGLTANQPAGGGPQGMVPGGTDGSGSPIDISTLRSLQQVAGQAGG